MSRVEQILAKIKNESNSKVTQENKEEFQQAIAGIVSTMEFAKENDMEEEAEMLKQAHDMAMKAAKMIDDKMDQEDEEPEVEPEKEPSDDEEGGEDGK